MGITDSIDITPAQRKIIVSLLTRYLPGITVWAFGSRVKWTSRSDSDLDLVAFSTHEQQGRVSALKEAFEESSLPFRIDLLVWNEIPENFRPNILEKHAVLMEAPKASPEERVVFCKWQTFETGQLINTGILIIGDGYRAKNSELSKEGLPFARAGNIDNGFHFEGADCFPVENLLKVGEKVSCTGDVVFTSKGTVGRFAFVGNKVPQFVYSPQLCYWRSLNFEIIEPRFLFYWMQGREFWEQACSVKGKTDMADYVSLSDQRRMSITLPPITYQRTIARILGDLDDKIELNRQINQTLEQMAQAIFKSWFVDFEPVKAKIEARAKGRNPERAAMCAISGKSEPELDKLPPEQYQQLAATAALFPDELVESELGLISEGWEVKPLDQIANYLNGLALQKFPSENDTEWLPIIKIAQLKKGDTEGADRASKKLKTEFVVNDGDVLFSWSGSLEVDIWCGGLGALNQHLFKVTSANYPKWFYLYWTKYHLSHFQAIAADKAVTMGHIQRKHLTEALCVAPPVSIIKQLGDFVAPLLEKQIEHRRESRRLASLRDTLLPKLLSGELSVDNLPEEVTP